MVKFKRLKSETMQESFDIFITDLCFEFLCKVKSTPKDKRMTKENMIESLERMAKGLKNTPNKICYK